MIEIFVILALLSLAGAGIKHFHNTWERGESNAMIVLVSIGFIVAAVFLTAPASSADLVDADKVSFSDVQPIMLQRCTPCHSKNCTDDAFIVAQGGVMFDSPEQIVQHKDRILNRAVTTKTMPLGNKTKMTDQERKLIETWIAQGAKQD